MTRRPHRVPSVVAASAVTVVLLFGLVPATFAAAPTSVTIAGSLQSELGCSADFQPDCATTHLAYDSSDDVWQGSFSPSAGSYDYKAAINDTWDENYGAGGVANGSNIALVAPGTPIKFYYDPNSHWVTDKINSRIITAAGSFQSEMGCPGDWQPDCLRSWLQDLDGNGTYTRTTTSLPLGAYEAKAAINESWDESYGAGGVANGGNIPFTVPANNTLVTFKFVSATNLLTIVVGDATDPTTSNVNVTLRQGGQIGSYPVLVSWTASDDTSAAANLSHKVQVRRWANGAWRPWSTFDSVTGIPAVTGSIPFWRTFQFRVRTRDEAGNWGAWALSNTINGWRRQERHFSLGDNWTITSTPGAMKGKTAVSSVVGARAQAHFEGNGASVVMPAESGLGTAEVCMDPGALAESCLTVDQGAFSPSGPRRLVATFTGMTPGTHVLRIRVVSGTVKLDGAVFTR